MNHLFKRSLSMIMAVLMVLAMIPANPVHVHAENGTTSSVEVVSHYVDNKGPHEDGLSVLTEQTPSPTFLVYPVAKQELFAVKLTDKEAFCDSEYNGKVTVEVEYLLSSASTSAITIIENFQFAYGTVKEGVPNVTIATPKYYKPGTRENTKIAVYELSNATLAGKYKETENIAVGVLNQSKQAKEYVGICSFKITKGIDTTAPAILTGDGDCESPAPIAIRNSGLFTKKITVDLRFQKPDGTITNWTNRGTDKMVQVSDEVVVIATTDWLSERMTETGTYGVEVKVTWNEKETATRRFAYTKGHTWAGDCDEKCNTCTETREATADHNWAEATFNAPKTCKTCGATQGVALIAVAEVNGTQYESLEAAFAAAAKGETIKLLADVTFSGQNAADKLSGYVIDLNDKTMTLSGNTYLTGETTIKNGNIVVSGFVSDSYLCLYTAATKLTLDDVKLTGAMDCYAVLNCAAGSTLIIQNSTIDVVGNVTKPNEMGNIIYGGNVTVDNSTIKGNNTVRGIGFSNITIQNGSTVEISNVETGLNCATVTVDNSTVTITNATKRAVRLNNNVLTLQNGAKLTATGCAEDIIGIGTTDTVSVSSDSTLNAVDKVTPVPVFVAQIGTQGYETLQAAIEAAQNGETITLLADCDEIVHIKKSNAALTIDGANFEYTGKIEIDIGQNVTIKNVNFVHENEDAFDFIANVGSPTGKNYNTTLVVDGCSFTGNGKDNVVAVRTIHPTSVLLKNSMGTELHSFLQNTGGQKVAVENITVTDSKGGLAAGTTKDVTISGCNLTTLTYGIRLDAVEANAEITLNSNAVNAYIPVSVRKATSAGYKLNVTGNNSYTATNPDGKWLAICTTEYEVGVELNEPTGKVDLVLSGTGADKSGAYGYYVAPPSGTGTVEDPIRITSVEDLLWLQEKVDEQAADGSTQFAGKYIKLTTNLDLAGINWNPIGSMSGDHGSFKGVFDGDGHTISNLNVQQAGNGLGLFARTAGNAEIKNLTLNNVTVKSTNNSNYVGAVVGNSYASTKITNVHVTGNIDISGRGYIGGISGHGYVVMDNVSVKGTGTISSTFWCAGGILGYGGEGTTNIMNAQVEGITITSAAGGLGAIVGMAEDNNGTQPISGSNLSAKNVQIKTYTGAYGDAYANYALGYLYGGSETSKLTGTLTVESVTITTSSGEEPTVVDAVASVGNSIYFSFTDAVKAAAAGAEIRILKAGTYKVPTGKNITITGAVDGVVFDNIGAHNMGGASVTFNNVTFDYYPNVNYTGLQHSGNLTYNNCTFNGQVFLYGQSETFNNCTFNQESSDAYNVWTYSAEKVEFNECTFNSAGKSVLIYHENASVFNDVTVTKSTFNASAAVDGKAAIEMDSSLMKGIELTIDGATTATGFGTGNVSGNSLWNNKKGNNDEANNDITVTVDGETVLAPKTFVAQIDSKKYFTLQDAFKAATSGCTIEILSDVTISEKWDCRDYATGGSHSQFKESVTINGNGHTIKFTGTVNDNNWNTIFRFEENATVNKLTIDISGATGAQRVISAKKSLTVDGLTIIGSAKYGIIFGEGASATDLAATEIVIKNSTLTGTRRAISDNEGGKDVKSVVITGNTLEANVYASASESIVFNNNAAAGEVDLRSNSADNDLSVVAQGNTLAAGAKNYIYAKNIDAQAEFNAENPPVKVSNKAELKEALAAAKDGDTIVLTADIDYGTDHIEITKAITLDLGGKTLTTRARNYGLALKNDGIVVTNGKLNHAGTVAAIKVWNAAEISYLEIDVTGTSSSGNAIGGIVLQQNCTGVNTIKNVKIHSTSGQGIANGIETNNCGNATEPVIGSLENVTIEAVGTAMNISAPVGTATNCIFKGGVNGVELWIKGTYSASLTLVTSQVEGGVSVHDEFASNVTNNGTLTLNTDAATTGVTTETVTLTINHAAEEQVQGEVLETIIENSVAQVNGTYYATLSAAIAAAKAGDVVTIFEGAYAVPTVKAGITIEGQGNVVLEGTLSGTLENLTLKNLHIKGSNAQRWAYAKGDLVFENVTFEATGVYALHFDGITAGATLTYKDCTIIGWAAMSGSPASCVFEGCTFQGNGTYGLIRTYFDATIENCTFDVEKVNTTDVYQDGIHAVDGATITVNNCTNANGNMKDIVNVSGASVVVLDGEKIQNAAKIGDTYYATYEAALKAAWENAYANNGAKQTIETVDGKAYATLGVWGGIDWTLTAEGTLTIAPTKGAPIADKNSGKTYAVGAWREAVRYNSKGEGVAVEGWPYDRTKVKHLVIEEGVISIGSFAAQGFTNLTGEVVIPSTVTYIGQEAFQKSTMTKLTFAAGGTEELCIAQGAFKNLIIEEVSLPADRPVHLHAWVFNNCHNLKTAYLPASLVSVHGTNHIDYFKDFNAHSNPTWTQSSEIFAYNENMETITFGSEEVMNMFYSKNNGTTKDYIVANVGLTTYFDFADAWAAVTENGGTIKLFKNVTLQDTLTVPAGKTITLDLNGKTISQTKECTASYEMINNKGNLTITGNGKISFTDTSAGDPSFGWGSYTIRNEGTLVVENGTIEHKGAQAFATHMICAIFQYSGSTTINGGTISTPSYRSVRLWKGDMTINGGSFDGQIWVQAVDGSAKLTINGGSFEPNGNDASSVFVTNAEHAVAFAVKGGTFNGKIGASDATKLAGAITGGTFSAAAASGTNSALIAEGLYFGDANADGYCALEKGLMGYGTEANPYKISSVEDLILFRDSVNAGKTIYNASGVYVVLTADINLASIENWAPIGTFDYSFDGNFNGNGHKIQNLKMSDNTAANQEAYLGFFGVTANNTIENFVIENVTINSNGQIVAAAIGYPYYTTVKDITVCGDIAIKGGNYTAGVLGYTRLCENASNLTVSGNAGSYITGANVVGGILSDLQMNKGLQANYFNFNVSGVTITGEQMVGGISGIIATQTLTGATVKNVKLVCSDSRVGTVAGCFGGTSTISSVTVENVTGAEAVIGGAYNGGAAVQAKIGDTYYATFADAYAAAQAGDTIDLLADIKASEVILIDKSLTINGNNHKITSSASRVFRVTAADVVVTLNDVNMVSTAVRVGTNDIRGLSVDNTANNAKVTLNNCSVDFTDASANDWTYAVNQTGANNVVLTINGGSYEGANVINVRGTSNTVVVKNATLTSLYPNNDLYYGACIYVVQDQNSSINATGNTFNGANAVAFNAGYTPVTESNNTDNTTKVVAKVGAEYYTSLADAFAAAQDGDTVKVLQNTKLTEGVKVPAGKAITLDLNGKTITGTDNATGSFGLFTNQGALTVTGNGTITLKATNNRLWNAYSSIFSNTVGGKLTIENGTFEHLGGTDMAYAIDNLTNGKGTYAETVINGGTIKSTYRAIRQFLNGVEAQNILTINGGTIKGANKSIWMQDPSKNANSGSLTVGANANLVGDVYLTVTAGSTEWPVEVSIAASAVNGEILSANVPATFVVENVNGTWGVNKGLKGSGTETDPYQISCAAELNFFRNSVNAGETKYNAPGVVVALTADIDMAGATWERGIGDGINATFDGIFDGNNKTIKNLKLTSKVDSDGYICGGLFGYTYGAVVIKNVVLENITVTTEGTGNNVGVLVGFAYNKGGKLNVSNVTVKNVTIDAPEAYGVGAIVGYSYGSMGTIDNCTVDGATITGHRFVGGITGYSYNDAVITNCTVKNATITGEIGVGGIAGLANANAVIEGNTVADTTVTASKNWGYVVGEIGSNSFTLGQNNAAEPQLGGVWKTEQAVQAKIGNTYYATFADAYAAAEAGDTIELLAPIVVNAGETLTLDKDVKIVYTSNVVGEDMFTVRGTLNVKAGTITYTNTDTTGSNVTVSTISCEPGSVLNVTGGTIENKTVYSTGSYAYAIDLLTNGNLGDVTVTISDGKVYSDYMAIRQFNNGTACKNTLTVSGGEIYGAKRAIQVHMDNTAAYTTISGGKIEGGDYALCLYAQNNENLTVSGGEFLGDVYSATNGFITGGTFEKVYEEYCTEGYIPVKNADGKYIVKAGKFVAQVNDTKYDSLAAAIADAKSGDTIVLLDNITEDVTIKNKSLTINGANKTYTGNILVEDNNQVAVTIKNVNFDGKGYNGYAVKTNNIKSITIEGCTVTGYTYGFLYANKSTGTIVVNDVTVDGGSYGLHWAYGSNATLENVTMTNVKYGILTHNYGAKTITLKNCSIDAETAISTVKRNETKIDTFVFEGLNTISALPESDLIKVVAQAQNQNGTKIGDLAAVVNGAVNGETITLLSDVTLTTADYVTNSDGYAALINVAGKAITIDLNGKAITVNASATDLAEAKSTMLMAVFAVDVNGKLTLKDSKGTGSVTVNANDANVYSLAICYGEGGKLNIESGSYTADAVSSALIYSQYDEVIIVSGGNFHLGNLGTGENGSPWIFNAAGQNTKNIIVIGGTYNADVFHQHYIFEVKDTFEVSELLGVPVKAARDNGDGTWTIVDAVAYVAEKHLSGAWYTQNVGYVTLTEAVAAAKAGETITLVADNAENVELAKAIVLNVNGKAYTGTVTLTDLAATLTAPETLNVITNIADHKAVFENGQHKVIAKVYVVQINDGAKYESLSEAIAAAKSGDTITLLDNITEDVTIKNKSLTINGANKTYTGNILVEDNNQVAVTIKNVNFDGKGYNGYAVKTNNIKSITIEGCTVTGYTYGFLYANKSTGTIVVNDVTVDGGSYGLHWAYGSNATLENVTMTNVKYGILTHNYGAKTITLKNCSIDAETATSTVKRNETKIDTFVFEGLNTISALPESDLIKVVAQAQNQNGTKIGDLAAVVNGAVNGETITLLSDVTLDASAIKNGAYGYETLMIVDGNDITIDFAGHTATVENYADASQYSNGIKAVLETVIFINTNASLTLTDSIGNGGIKVPANENVEIYSMFYNCGGKLTIEEGIYTIEKGHAAASIIYAEDAHSTTINGGVYTMGNAPTDGNKPWIFNTEGKNESFVYVYGGTYNQNPLMNYATAKDCEVKIPNTLAVKDNGDNTWTIVDANVCVGDVAEYNEGFVTLAEAIKFAKADDTVILMADNAENVELAKAIVLNVNGKSYTGTVTLTDLAATLTAPKNLDVVSGVETHYAIYENGAYVLTLCPAQNENTGKYYASIYEALAAAKSGETVKLLVDGETETLMMIGAGVKLNLNGHTVAAGNVFSFGDIIDNDGTTDGKGGIIISNDRTKAFVQLQKDNDYLPLYDAADGCYRFYSYSVALGKYAATSNTIKFKFNLRLSDKHAYELLADAANSGIEITARLQVTGLEQEIAYKLTNEVVKKYADAALAQIAAGKNAPSKVSTVMELNVSGLGSLASGTTITFIAEVDSETGVTYEHNVNNPERNIYTTP